MSSILERTLESVEDPRMMSAREKTMMEIRITNTRKVVPHLGWRVECFLAFFTERVSPDS